MGNHGLDHGASLSLPPCALLDGGGRVPEEDLQRCACSLFQIQNLLGFHFDRANGETEG